MAETDAASEGLAALERFVVENDDLLALEERIGRFNIFDALGIARAEVRHSNFLAWLLDPAESHGQGDLFLKAVLMDLVRHAREQGFAPPFSPVHLDGADMGSVEIRREWKNIDLLILSAEPSFVIAIENKVDSGEHSDQLQRYEKTVAAEFPARPALFVFLTPDGSAASDDDWVSYSYADLHRVLTRVKRTNSGGVGPDVAAFLDHYLRLIESRMMDDPQIDELCRRIYKNHRAAIDLITQRAGVGRSEVLRVAADALSERHERWHLYTTRRNEVDFTYRPLLEAAPLGLGDGSWLNMNFNLYRENAISTQIGANESADMELRRRIIERITRSRDEFGLRTFGKKSLEKKWISLGFVVLCRWPEDADVDPDVIRGAVTKQLDEWEERWSGLADAVREVR